MLLAATQANAAEWREIGVSSEATIYINDATVRARGSHRKVWLMRNLKTAEDDGDGKKYLSVKSLFDVECQERTASLISFTQYSGIGGNGKVVYSAPNLNNKQSDIVPGSVMDAVHKEVCK